MNVKKNLIIIGVPLYLMALFPMVEAMASEPLPSLGRNITPETVRFRGIVPTTLDLKKAANQFSAQILQEVTGSAFQWQKPGNATRPILTVGGSLRSSRPGDRNAPSLLSLQIFEGEEIIAQLTRLVLPSEIKEGHLPVGLQQNIGDLLEDETRAILTVRKQGRTLPTQAGKESTSDHSGSQGYLFALSPEGVVRLCSESRATDVPIHAPRNAAFYWVWRPAGEASHTEEARQKADSLVWQSPRSPIAAARILEEALAPQSRWTVTKWQPTAKRPATFEPSTIEQWWTSSQMPRSPQPLALSEKETGTGRNLETGQLYSVAIKMKNDGFVCVLELHPDGTWRRLFPDSTDPSRAFLNKSEEIPLPLLRTRSYVADQAGLIRIRAYYFVDPAQIEPLLLLPEGEVEAGQFPILKKETYATVDMELKVRKRMLKSNK